VYAEYARGSPFQTCSSNNKAGENGVSVGGLFADGRTLMGWIAVAIMPSSMKMLMWGLLDLFFRVSGAAPTQVPGKDGR